MTIKDRIDNLIDSLTFLCEDLETSPEQFDAEQTLLLNTLDYAIYLYLRNEGN